MHPITRTIKQYFSDTTSCNVQIDDSKYPLLSLRIAGSSDTLNLLVGNSDNTIVTQATNESGSDSVEMQKLLPQLKEWAEKSVDELYDHSVSAASEFILNDVAERLDALFYNDNMRTLYPLDKTFIIKPFRRKNVANLGGYYHAGCDAVLILSPVSNPELNVRFAVRMDEVDSAESVRVQMHTHLTRGVDSFLAEVSYADLRDKNSVALLAMRRSYMAAISALWMRNN